MQIILLALGVIYFFRKIKIRKMVDEQYPGVDPMKFSEWKMLELKSIDIFLMTTWGLLALMLALALLAAFISSNAEFRGALDENFMATLRIVYWVVFVGGLVYSAILGTRASKLKKSLNLK